MKKTIYLLTILFSLATQASLAQKSESLKWLIGTWKINTGQGTVVESWKQLNDSTFLGKSVFVKSANDTLPQESLELKWRKGIWQYISTVQGQNNNQPVSFNLIYVGRSEFISENPEHDFPQRIAYRRLKNQLFASIEGNKKGKFSKLNFDFTSD